MDIVKNTTTHVTEYAKTNVVEDLAESFAFYVAQDNIPISTSSSSGALQKINFIGSRSITNLKDGIKKILKVKSYSDDPEIHAYMHRGRDGKQLSCKDKFKLYIESLKNREK